MTASPQPRLPTVTASPAAFSDSRKSWSGLFEATTPLSSRSSGFAGPAGGTGTRSSTRAQSPTQQSTALDDHMLLLTLVDDEDLPEITLTWRSLQSVHATHPRGLTNYGNMCFLNAVGRG